MDKQHRNKLIDRAIDCMKKHRKEIAYDANLARTLAYPPPAMKRRLEEYDEILEATQMLEDMKKG